MTLRATLIRFYLLLISAVSVATAAMFASANALAWTVNLHSHAPVMHKMSAEVLNERIAHMLPMVGIYFIIVLFFPSNWSAVFIGFSLGGMAGNLIDAYTLGAVTDWIQVWPIERLYCSVGDIFLWISLPLLMITIWTVDWAKLYSRSR